MTAIFLLEHSSCFRLACDAHMRWCLSRMWYLSRMWCLSRMWHFITYVTFYPSLWSSNTYCEIKCLHVFFYTVIIIIIIIIIFIYCNWVVTRFLYSNNNNNNIYLLQLGCYPVAVVILHVYKTRNWLLLNLSREGYV